MTVCASVVVPTRDRYQMLERCLVALSEQTCERHLYEILVVDDANSECTRRQVEKWTARPRDQCCRVRYLATGVARGPAAARNRGWRAAEGHVIAFTDDDCVPQVDWLEQGLNAFTGDVAGVSGRIIVPVEACPTDYQRNVAHLTGAEFVTANCFYLRDEIEAAGGFDERFTMAWREDTDLFFRLLSRGKTLVHEPSAVVTHPVRDASWGVSLRQQRKSQFNALLYKKHPDRYRERVQAAPPWRYYRICGALMAALAAFFTVNRRASAASFGLWALLTSRFCWERLTGASHAPGHGAEMVVTSVLIPPLAVFWRIRGAVRFRVMFL
ncbi:MAG: glycosyltransferase family 2 protein [Chloroflexota bacterium]